MLLYLGSRMVANLPVFVSEYVTIDPKTLRLFEAHKHNVTLPLPTIPRGSFFKLQTTILQMLTLVFDRFCWAKLYLNAALVEMAEEPRAHGFRPNEAWDRSLEERAEDVSV